MAESFDLNRLAKRFVNRILKQNNLCHWRNESIRKNGIRSNGACPVECLPNEMRGLFHRGRPATTPNVGFNRGEEHQGQLEVVLPDGTRFDCVTDTHVVEFDFGINWAEAICQSAYYSLQTKKRAGIVLIIESIKDRKYWIRLNTTIEDFDLLIDTWSVGPAAYDKSR